MCKIWAISILLCGAHLTTSDSESVTFGSIRKPLTARRQETVYGEKTELDQETQRLNRKRLKATVFPLMDIAITKPYIVEYNLTKNFVFGSWPTLNSPDREILEPLPTPVAFQHPAHGSYVQGVTVPGQSFVGTTNDDQAAGDWTRALPISNILSQEKRQIQGPPGENSETIVQKELDLLYIDIKSEKVIRHEFLADKNLTLNPFLIDEEFFDKDKSDYLSTLGHEGEYQSSNIKNSFSFSKRHPEHYIHV